MKHLFVSYEIAKQLKDKGFDKPCFAHYNPNGVFMRKIMCSDEDNDHTLSIKDIMEHKADGYIEAPLYQQVLDWLDLKQNINIWVDCSSKRQWMWTINFIEKGDYIQSDDDDNTDDRTWWETKTEALDKAIEKALKLI